jgi:hypothetical protein
MKMRWNRGSRRPPSSPGPWDGMGFFGVGRLSRHETDNPRGNKALEGRLVENRRDSHSQFVALRCRKRSVVDATNAFRLKALVC